MSIALVETAVSSCLMCAQESHIKTFPSGTRISWESARTFPSFSLVTRSTLRTERSRPSKSLSTERRTSNTTIFQLSQTINSKSHSSGSSEDSLGKNNKSFVFKLIYLFIIVTPTSVWLKFHSSNQQKLLSMMNKSKPCKRNSKMLPVWNSQKVKMKTSEHYRSLNAYISHFTNHY